MQPDRFRLRSAILTDLNLSEGARLFYLFLDDQGRGKPIVKMKQLRISVMMGISPRELQNRLAELVVIGHLFCTRGRYGNEYRLPFSDTHTRAYLEGPDTHGCAGQIRTPVRISSLYVNQEHPRTTDELVLREVQAELRNFPGAQRLDGEPDEDIARRTLDAAGSIDRLRVGLSILHRRRAAPRASWAWFPVVIGKLKIQPAPDPLRETKSSEYVSIDQAMRDLGMAEQTG